MKQTTKAPARAIVIASPVAVGHVRPLLPLARRLVERGFAVVWAISGDANEPAAAWRKTISDLGVQFIDIDEVAGFSRGATDPEFASTSMASLCRRIVGRANDVAEPAAAAIRAAVGERPIACGFYDYFALWGYVALRRIGVVHVDAVLSAFPTVIDDGIPEAMYVGDPVYQREYAQLRAGGFGAFDKPFRSGIVPRDADLRILSFSSPLLCDAPPGVHVLGLQRDALPNKENLAAASEEHQALAHRLRLAREGGARVLLLSMGTVVTRMYKRFGGAHLEFLRRLYTTVAASALRAGAVVVASISESSAADLGVDEAALGPAARDRVIAMSFVPQPFLFAHGLVDVLLMHGGANTFHEAVVSGIPVLISPAFGDQEYVAMAADRLGVGVCVESISIPHLPRAISLGRLADDVLPAMLAPGVTPWKAKATSLAARIGEENGLDAAEAFVLSRCG